VKKEPQLPNGQPQLQIVPSVPSIGTTPSEPPWEPSITNVVPVEDLTRRLCAWIYSILGEASEPQGGAVFEIEAKLGSIFDEQASHRLSLPVETEAFFNRDKYRGRTSFKSSMNMVSLLLTVRNVNCS